jgi:transmembrane sensor
MAAAVLMAALSWWLLYPGETYSTDIGELRTVELAVGSRIELNARSRVRVDFSATEREVRLLEGEALFDVARDAGRPFQVRSGGSRIQAVGTQFTVNRRPLTTLVSVLEGSVNVIAGEQAGAEKELLSAGEAVRIGIEGRIGPREPAAGANLAAWRERRLVFRDDALADISAEFNRYNRSPQIVVTGKAMDRRYGGIFDADDPQSIVRFVTRDGELKITHRDGRILIQ